MVCDICNEKEGVVFLEAMTNKGKLKINLCPQCAANRGISAPQISPCRKDFGEIFEEVYELRRKRNPDYSKLCPVCGKSLAFIKESKQAGCPECYEIFKDEIYVLLKEMGISGVYTGTMPKRLNCFRNSLTDRADIQAKLDQAVREENYEKAAVYRDFLRALEKSSVSDGSNQGEL